MAYELEKSFFESWTFSAGASFAASILICETLPPSTYTSSYLFTATTILLLESVILGIYNAILWPRFLSPLRHLPTVTDGASLINGQLATIVKEPTGVPLRRWMNEIPNDGFIRYLHFLNRERLLLLSPKTLAEVLVNKTQDFAKPNLLKTGIGKILGNGLLLVGGEEHKIQRKGLGPAFNFRHIKEMYSLFWSKGGEMVKTIQTEELEKNAPNVTIEIGQWASRATLDIIGLGGIGQDFAALANPDTELSAAYRSVFSSSGAARTLAILEFFIPLWLVRLIPVKRNKEVVAAAKLARDSARRLLRTKKANLEKNEPLYPDIISIALESGAFTEDTLVNNMMTFMAAGHETAAVSLTWAVYLLCQKPDVQTRLREEIHAHITSLDSPITDTIIDGMPLLHAVCQETLRLYPPVAVTLRHATVNTSICDQFVPKGTTIVLAPWAINCSKELWGSDAEEFSPDRWLKPGQTNSGGASSNYAFMTFLHGPRNCIGSRFALAEMSCLLAAFVGRYHFEMTYPDEIIDINGGFTCKPRDGIRINLTKVEMW